MRRRKQPTRGANNAEQLLALLPEIRRRPARLLVAIGAFGRARAHVKAAGKVKEPQARDVALRVIREQVALHREEKRWMFEWVKGNPEWPRMTVAERHAELAKARKAARLSTIGISRSRDMDVGIVKRAPFHRYGVAGKERATTTERKTQCSIR
jgi:hypothetical protein